MAHEVEQTRKPTNSSMILSKNDFVEFRSSQPGEILKMTLNDSLWPDIISLKATERSEGYPWSTKHDDLRNMQSC